MVRLTLVGNTICADSAVHGPNQIKQTNLGENLIKNKLANYDFGCTIKRDNFDSEREAVKFARRSVVSTMNISKNSIISKEMLTVKRPGTGISPKFFDNLIGKKTIKDISEDQVLQWEDISE